MPADLHGVLAGRRRDLRVTLVVAHPDDETLGVGSRLATLGSLTIVHVTDGSPLNLLDACTHGFGDARSYARQRRRELNAALEAGGVQAELVELGFPDQTASANMSRVTMSLASRFSRARPDLILTHAYEGGHPDHDATAFAIAAACDLVGIPRGQIAEFAGYHGRDGRLVNGEFLENRGEEIVCELTPEELGRKRRMIESFVTQQQTLAQFRLDMERFRFAPRYDFNEPPHPGVLWYERFNWSMTGSQFRWIATRVQDELELHMSAAQ